ncbi:MAG: hypothetical protein IJX30_00570 [Clostridia bacterium]|nr:hypothetical protein [Clostridia bacterium]MBQ8428580.1 hypothetical protein [Clostridia bacterium]
MKLGEVKADALKLMGIDNLMNVTWGDIDGLKNHPSYATYLFAMVGAIKRALDRFYVKGAIDSPIQTLNDSTAEAADLSDYGVNDVLARMIPKYVVGELYAMEEPDVAANSRNEFESELEEYLNMQCFQQETVDVVHPIW